MNSVMWSRLQFGLTAGFHFLFPPLTIGLAALIAIMEFLYWRTDQGIYDRLSRFWTRIFIIPFVIGVATGITMEFQFGTNWSSYARFVGDIFGAPLAAEGLLAFFLESSFVGILVFGRDRLSRAMRFWAAFFVALGSALSALWIIIADSWMQTPAGFRVEGGRAVLTNFLAAALNPSTLPRFLHVIAASFTTGGFFVLAISAYYLLRGRNLELARRSLKLALGFTAVVALLQIYLGDVHAKEVAAQQPVKLAAYEGLWQTQTKAPLLLIGWPEPSQSKTAFAIGVPGVLSYLAKGQTSAPVQGLNAFPPANRPPILPVFISFHLMVWLGFFFAFLVLWGLYLWRRGRLFTSNTYLKALLYSLPLPFLANELGWISAEIGRQPWIVYGVLRTNQAASPLPGAEVVLTTVLFVVVYSFLFGSMLHLLRREIGRGLTEEPAVLPIPSAGPSVTL